MTESKRRSFDPRLPIGIVVILTSIAAAVGLVIALDRSATAWAAPHDLVVGDVVRFGDLQPRPVRLDLVEGAYLVGALDQDAEFVVARTVGVGELVPISAVGEPASIDTAVVVVAIGGPIASGLTAGSSADLWAAPSDGATGFGPPVVLVSAAVVGRVDTEAGIVAGSTVAIEVVIPRERVARVLEALANGAAISLVPAVPRPPSVTIGPAQPGDSGTPQPTPHPTDDGSTAGDGS